MSLLAEPRRKQKLSSDPRGLNWSNDDNKFGQKLMEKMGWEKGHGLGAKQDGDVNHIAVPFKADTRGVGCTKSYEDNWIAHQDDFNSLLAELNQSTDTNKDTSTPVQNMMEKSKASKGRLHYQKFTKGKDLSSAKNCDMDSIMGRRKIKSNPSTPQMQSEANSEDEAQAERAAAANNFYGINTISTGTSVNDYFAMQMAALKARAAGKADTEANNNEDVNNGVCAEEQDEEPLQKKKKKRKSYVIEENAVEASANEMPKKKKKKKSKDVDNESSVDGDLESPPEKRKKKKKSKKGDAESEPIAEDVKQKKKKNKSKRTEPESDQEGDSSSTPEDNTQNKDKSEGKCDSAATSSTDKFHGITTISTGVSMQDYFAKKMAEKKNKAAEKENLAASRNNESLVESSSTVKDKVKSKKKEESVFPPCSNNTIEVDDSEKNNSLAHKFMKIANCESLLESSSTPLDNVRSKNRNTESGTPYNNNGVKFKNPKNNNSVAQQFLKIANCESLKSNENKKEENVAAPCNNTKFDAEDSEKDNSVAAQFLRIANCESLIQSSSTVTPIRKVQAKNTKVGAFAVPCSNKIINSEETVKNDSVDHQFMGTENCEVLKESSSNPEENILGKKKKKSKKTLVPPAEIIDQSLQNESSLEDTSGTKKKKSKKTKAVDEADIEPLNNYEEINPKKRKKKVSKMATSESTVDQNIESVSGESPVEDEPQPKRRKSDSKTLDEQEETQTKKKKDKQKKRKRKSEETFVDDSPHIGKLKKKSNIADNGCVDGSGKGQQNTRESKKSKDNCENQQKTSTRTSKSMLTAESSIVETTSENTLVSKKGKCTKQRKSKTDSPNVDEVSVHESSILSNFELIKSCPKHATPRNEHSSDSFISKIFPGSNLDTFLGYGDGLDIGFGPGRGLLKEKLMKKI